MKKIFKLAAPLIIAGFFAGCLVPIESHRVTTNPLSVADVITLSKANVGDDLIISQIKATRTVYRLTPSQIIELKNAGLSQKVIDYMINTPSTQSSSESATVAPAPYYYPYPVIEFDPFFPIPPPPPFHGHHHW